MFENLSALHLQLDACRACPRAADIPVHGPAIPSRVMLVGQAPGPREASFGRPFAWTAGKTLFRWLESATGASEAHVRERIYFAAVTRCFPGKANGGGDRVPAPDEIARCRRFLEGEVALLQPELVLAVGRLAIEQVLETKQPLVEVIGRPLRTAWLGREVDVLCLPHPSGASTWYKREPGKALLQEALDRVARHPAVRAALGEDASMAPSSKGRAR